LYLQQRTLAEKVSCTGVGLHSGAPVHMTLHPARVNSGVRFVRHGDGGPHEIPARPDSVSSTAHATTLGRGKGEVSTVEHLLAALYANSISNVCIELDGPEVPVMDGSAASFIHLIRTAGIYDQHQSQGVLEVDRPIEVTDGARRIRIEPARHLQISYTVEFSHPAIGRQKLNISRLTPAVFASVIARARTFGFLSEVEALRKGGRARGGSLDNTLVLDSTRVINPGGLRWPDEFVRHKVLDLVGDLSLLGLPIRGHVVVERGGHEMHHRLVNAILREPDAWSLRGVDASYPQVLQLFQASAAS
jgi:UDP-3-O-[3-hydroxymyristoyl] N-acetylglucosamine deacetylase